MSKGKSAEAYANHLATTAYLKYWCYPNPIDEDGDKKEICDLLILFNDVCIIFSIKNYDLKGNQDRFRKKVIKKSTNQLYGAERKLFHSARQIKIKHPDREIEVFDSSRYHNIYRITVNLGELFENYDLADIEDGKALINIIHKDSFSEIIQELDTIPDFVAYLKAREDLLISQYPIIIEGTELDLLATYILSGRIFPKEYFERKSGLSLNLKGRWNAYNQEYAPSKKHADLQSYIIDTLVDRDILKEKWGELLAQELMHLSRFNRRYIGESLYELIEKCKRNNIKNGARRHTEVNGILFLLIAYPTDTIADIDRIINDAGSIYMYKFDYNYEKIIILGACYDLSESKYGIVIRNDDVNEEGKKYLEDLCNQYGWFQSMERTEKEFKEFPNAPD